MILLNPYGRARPSAVLAGLAVVLYTVLSSSPEPGFSGRRLVVLALTVVCCSASLLWMVIGGRTAALEVASLLAMGVAGAVLAGVSPRSAAVAFAFVAVLSAARLLELTPAVAIAAITIACLAASLGALDRGSGALFGYSAGLAAAALTGRNLRAYVRGREQAELLLAETQVAREEQARTAALAERARIAREIHDVLAHSLSALSVQLEGARMLLSAQRDIDAALVQLERAQRLARDGLVETRRAIGALRGDTPPLPELLHSLARDQPGLAVRLEVQGAVRELTPEVTLAVYRAAQEAVTNARKHAPEASVELRLAYLPQKVRLSVVDRRPSAVAIRAGSLASSGGGYGLAGMRERAELLGGELTAQPTEDGWRVELSIPA